MKRRSPTVSSEPAEVFLRVEHLGDAEVEQLDVALGRDEHVARLEVAMHDQVLVGVLHGVADLECELEARGTDMRSVSQYASIGRPSTYSITR